MLQSDRLQTCRKYFNKLAYKRDVGSEIHTEFEEECLKQKRQQDGVHKKAITKKLKFDSFEKPKLQAINTSSQTSKENIMQCPECYKICADPPSEN
ncbi:hypothetical protein AVEN_225611-1 [Araneus ventricosus]|uniref:Uncharacterized protein n=1 Tax=Araneus ventricosus TaxID=182803 RepID=A0A4Y2F0Q0_ARAVE|nr:hypothetical protein AVEN_225611-1 [Araneus ventricosus]